MSAAATMKSRGVKRQADKITVRKMDFEFSDDIAEFWCDDNPFLTAFLTGLSISFPAGERFFIDSVRQFQSQIDDPLLLKNIRAFIGQEAHHTKEHSALNDFMARKGYPVERMESFIRERIAWMQENSGDDVNLARTVALEHFTAIMAGAFLDHSDLLDKMDPAMAKLWAWHAIEEIEHRSVAFDVYKNTVDDEKLRRRTMRRVTYFFILMNAIRTWKLMGVSGQRYNVKAWASGLNMLWGRPGVLRKIVPQYLSFYRRGFHPSQHDNRARVKQARLRYLGETMSS